MVNPGWLLFDGQSLLDGSCWILDYWTVILVGERLFVLVDGDCLVLVVVAGRLLLQLFLDRFVVCTVLIDLSRYVLIGLLGCCK